ncbi:hypothetical protein [Flavobacterium sp.]|uniref:hypothetical protein n=1 Tax=Flavobacterium sp. TaxID=239 RepID=UPI003D0A968B
MKTYIIFFITILCLFSFNCFAQQSSNVPVIEETEQVRSQSDNNIKEDLVIAGYYVEETVHMAFGISVTKYKVSKLNLINTYDLGPNNTRIVTPIYEKAKVKPSEPEILSKVQPTELATLSKMQPLELGLQPKANPAEFGRPSKTQSVEIGLPPKVQSTEFELSSKSKPVEVVLQSKSQLLEIGLQSKAFDTIATTIKPINVEVAASAERPKYVIIDVVNTYSKVLDKGYKSVDMLTKVADKAYFNGDLEVAAKYYAELLAMKINLEPMYYYRYAQSLKGIGQIEKADEMMKLFEAKSKAYKGILAKE